MPSLLAGPGCCALPPGRGASLGAWRRYNPAAQPPSGGLLRRLFCHLGGRGMRGNMCGRAGMAAGRAGHLGSAWAGRAGRGRRREAAL